MSDLSRGSQTTRRGLLVGNVKAIAAITAGALVSRLTPAEAFEDHYRDHYGDRYRDRYADRFGDHYRDHFGDRYRDHSWDRFRHHFGNRFGGDHGDHGGHHSSGGQGNCFLKGTKIRTSEGECRVEDLAAGDLLPTAFGGLRPIQWIERFWRTKADAAKPWPAHARPIRIMKSALAPNVPQSDLFVTSGHALLLDGVLVTARCLVNGTTIARYAADEYDELEFFQIKLETHDAIFAEGAPCETLLKGDASEAGDSERGDARQTSGTQDAYCAPIFGNGARSELKWRMHSVMSRWIGPHTVDVIRDRLEERSQIAMCGR